MNRNPWTSAALEVRVVALEYALRELVADLAYYEAGNPWRLDSMKNASRLLTGEPYGLDSLAVFELRARAGVTGGRFSLPYLGDALEPLRVKAERNARKFGNPR